MRILLRYLGYLVLYLALCFATFLMLRMVLGYSSFDSQTAFLLYKQDYLSTPFWQTAFYIHVFSAIVTLLAGFTQFSRVLLAKQPAIHRWLGRLYGWNILLINVPIGLYLAIHANGGLTTRIAFVLLDILWCWFTLQGIIAIRSGNVPAHREFMIRSFALTLSAITLRSWNMILSNVTDIDAGLLYQIDAWLGFVPNLLVAEWIIRKKSGALTPGELNVIQNNRSKSNNEAGGYD